MDWAAILGAILSVVLEIIQLVREVRSDKKEEALELKKQKTEIIQSVVRGIVDRDASRINSGIDKLRRMR